MNSWKDIVIVTVSINWSLFWIKVMFGIWGILGYLFKIPTDA